jgi:dephospho-CoA kinase
MTHPQDKPVIGLLGAPGSGKSTVARALAAEGCAVIDADRLSHEALEEPDVVEQLRQWWGEGVIGPDGRPDRAAIGRIVFQDAAERERLEGLLHPRVHARRRELRAACGRDPAVRAIVEDMPLLLEKGLADQVDALVFVAAPRAQRLRRLADSRGWDAAEVDRREKSQVPLDTKRARADYVIDNRDGADLASAARRLLDDFLHGTT